MIRRLALAAGLLIALAPTLHAQHEHGAPAAAGASAERHHADGWRAPPNTLALFTGVALEGDERAFSLGLDYERRLSRRFGVGLLVDDAFGDLREYVGFAALYWHPTHALRVDLAPGVEVRRIEDEPDEWEFAFRVGADYDFPLGGRWFVAPNANLDLVGDRTVWVLGAEVGFHF